MIFAMERNRELISLKEIEGAVSPHQAQVERALKARQEALEYVSDVSHKWLISWGSC